MPPGSSWPATTARRSPNTSRAPAAGGPPARNPCAEATMTFQPTEPSSAATAAITRRPATGSSSAPPRRRRVHRRERPASTRASTSPHESARSRSRRARSASTSGASAYRLAQGLSAHARHRPPRASLAPPEGDQHERDRAGQGLHPQDLAARGQPAEDARHHDTGEEEDLDPEAAHAEGEPPEEPGGQEPVVETLVGRERLRGRRELRGEAEGAAPLGRVPEKHL